MPQPIHLACSQGHLELVKWLAKQEGVSLTAEDNDGKQPIDVADSAGHHKVVEWLTRKKGEKEIRRACESGDLEAIKTLAKQKGISLTAEDNHGRQPIHWACSQGHLELVKWLAEQRERGVSLTAIATMTTAGSLSTWHVQMDISSLSSGWRSRRACR